MATRQDILRASAIGQEPAPASDRNRVGYFPFELALDGAPMHFDIGALMGQKLNPVDLALYRAVDEVLHYVWDH